MQPKVLMMDEPTSALDPELVAEVLDVTAELARQGVTLLIVTHEMGFACAIAHRMLFLDEGTVAEEGIREKHFVPLRPVSRSIVFPEIPLQHEVLFGCR